MTDDKKDYIFNIRLSRDTYEKLKTTAKENRETMSNLARKVIDDGLEIFGDITSDLFGEKKEEPEVVHYYEVTLSSDMICAKTKKQLKEGQKAWVGETRTGKKYYFHKSCFSK